MVEVVVVHPGILPLVDQLGVVVAEQVSGTAKTWAARLVAKLGGADSG